MKQFIVSAMMVSVGLTTATVYADGTMTRDCQAIRARAAGDAAMLLSPSVAAEGIKYPATGGFAAIGGSTTVDGLQARAYFLWSPLDAYKSVLVRELGDKDCAQQAAIIQASGALEQLNDIGKETALQNQIDYLQNQQSMMSDIIFQAQKRVGAGAATIMDLMVLQQTVSTLSLKMEQARMQLDTVRAKHYVVKQNSFAELMLRVQDTSMSYERQFSKVRMLQPWQINMQGGVVPPMTSSDNFQIFGVLTATYNFGGLFLGKHEDQYLSAREHELRSARYELSDQLSRFRETVRSNMIDLQRQLQVVDTQLNKLQQMHAQLLDHMDVPTAQNAEALIQLQMFDAESTKALLSGMLAELTKFYGDK